MSPLVVLKRFRDLVGRIDLPVLVTGYVLVAFTDDAGFFRRNFAASHRCTEARARQFSAPCQTGEFHIALICNCFSAFRCTLHPSGRDAAPLRSFRRRKENRMRVRPFPSASTTQENLLSIIIKAQKWRSSAPFSFGEPYRLSAKAPTFFSLWPVFSVGTVLPPNWYGKTVPTFVWQYQRITGNANMGRVRESSARAKDSSLESLVPAVLTVRTAVTVGGWDGAGSAKGFARLDFRRG